MTEIKRLIEEFAADYEAGAAVRPEQLLARVEPAQRQELAEELDRYLMTAPARRWDPKAFEGSLAQRAVERVYESIEGVSGAWPEVLPRLRNRARIKRAALVERLAVALGFTDAPRVEKVARYYNRMEHGLLPASGVSRRVIEALAAILGTDPEQLRVAGMRRGEGTGPAQPAFARTAYPDAELIAEDADAGEPGAAAAPREAEAGRDEIDELFLGG